MIDSLIKKIKDRSEQYYEEDSILAVYSIDHAIQCVLSKPHRLRQIVNIVIDNNLHGDDKSFHKLITICKELNDYDDAHHLCRFALGSFATEGYDSLLLDTDIIEIGITYENPVRKCESYVEKVLNISREHWDLSLFNAVFEYYYKLISYTKNKEIFFPFYEKAKTITLDMQTFFLWDEDGYYDRARLLILVGEKEEAKRLLESWIDDYPPDIERDTCHYLRCPKCCRLWIEEFKESNGNARFLRKVLFKGARESEDEEDKLFFINQLENLAHRLKLGVETDSTGAVQKITYGYAIDTYNKIEQ